MRDEQTDAFSAMRWPEAEQPSSFGIVVWTIESSKTATRKGAHRISNPIGKG